MRNKELAIVILSCDKFSSLWPLFFKRLNQYFPKSNNRFYLLSNNLKYEVDTHHLVKVICVGNDTSWSDNLSKLLVQINEENVLLLMEDGPLAKNVNLEKLNFYHDVFIKNNMNYLNLKASPKPDKNINPDFGEISPFKGYRTALVPSLWKKSILLSLLKKGESAWEFEVLGSERSSSYENFFSLNKPLFTLDHIIVKGKIERKIFKKLKFKNEHLDIEFPVMSKWESLKDYFLGWRSLLLSFLIPDFILLYLRKIRYSKKK
tara:strand:+ start:457 stop:1242 length:786 start_codon:yes stop_codon:yes gene_type:complete